MKTKEELIHELTVVLFEIENRTHVDDHLKTYLETRLETLNWVLGDDVPQEYWERIEDIIGA